VRPFAPKGEQPEWRMLYDLVTGSAVDTVFPYDDFDRALGRDFRENRTPLARVQKELLREDKRVLVNVRGVGYRIAQAREHGELAVGQRQRARRAVDKGVQIVAGADQSSLTPKERQRLTEIEVNLRAQANMLRRTEARVAVLEKSAKHSDDRLDMLLAELKRKGLVETID